jgi:hypothetical protein
MDFTDRDLIAMHPEVFSSFYSLPSAMDRSYLYDLRLFLLWASWHSRWLLVTLKTLTKDILKGFDAWQDWVRRTGRQRPHQKIADYYLKHLFHRDFLKFMNTEIAEKYTDRKHIINALVDYDLNLLALKLNEQTALEKKESSPLMLQSLPVRYNNMKLRTVEADYDQILRCLKKGISLSSVHREKIHLIMRLRQSKVDIVRIPPLLAEILRLCSGKLTVGDIMKTFTRRHPTVDGMSGNQACLYGLNLLIEQKLIRIAPRQGIN